MAYIKVFGDGSTDPPINAEDIVIMINRGEMVIGYFNKDKYRAEIFWIDEITVDPDISNDIYAWLLKHYPEVFFKKHPIHILCPSVFSNKIKAPGS